MGGEFQAIEIYLYEGETLEERFHKVVAGAQWDFGHAGYSGTFAEKIEGVRVIDRPQKYGFEYWQRDDAQNHAHEYNEKWGPAFAYLIGEGHYYVAGWCSS